MKYHFNLIVILTFYHFFTIFNLFNFNFNFYFQIKIFKLYQLIINHIDLILFTIANCINFTFRIIIINDFNFNCY